MLPFLEHPSIEIAGRTLYAFQGLVVAAVIVGFEIAVRRAGEKGFNQADTSRLVAWTIFWGFVGSHLFALLVHSPERLRAEPLALLQVWGAMSSFGGMLGGIAGLLGVAWLRGLSGTPLLRQLDNVAFAFPFAWILGRTGCALAHDHMGIRTDHWLAVRAPGGPRLDLGLLEAFYTIPLAVLFFALDRRSRPNGLYLGLFFTLYGPARFTMDALRTGETRYLGWTPGQFLSALATLAGIGGLVLIYRVGLPRRLPQS